MITRAGHLGTCTGSREPPVWPRCRRVWGFKPCAAGEGRALPSGRSQRCFLVRAVGAPRDWAPVTPAEPPCAGRERQCAPARARGPHGSREVWRSEAPGLGMPALSPTALETQLPHS